VALGNDWEGFLVDLCKSDPELGGFPEYYEWFERLDPLMLKTAVYDLILVLWFNHPF